MRPKRYFAAVVTMALLTVTACSVTGSTNGGTPKTATSSGVSAQGVTSSEIKIGILAPQHSAAAIKADAAAGLSVGNVQLESATIGAYINSQGGIAGRKVTFADYNYNMLATSLDAENQAACTYWTQDAKVFATIMPYNTTDQILSCLASANTPLIGGLPSRLGTPAIMSQYKDYFFSPSDPSIQGWITAMVNAFTSDGFFTPQTKIGLVYTPDEQWVYGRQLFTSLLSSHGIKLADQASVGTLPQIQAAALKFKQAGVNRLVIFDSHSGGVTIPFLTTTASDHYYPRVGLYSEDNPGGVEQSIPIAAFAGSQGIGWRPIGDIDFAHQPAPSSSGALCLNLLAKAGERYKDQLAEWTALSVCDALLSLRAALKGATVVTPQTLAAGYHKLGTSYVSALSLGDNFTHSNAGASRMESFDFRASCKCFQYTGTFYSVSSS